MIRYLLSLAKNYKKLKLEMILFLYCIMIPGLMIWIESPNSVIITNSTKTRHPLKI